MSLAATYKRKIPPTPTVGSGVDITSNEELLLIRSIDTLYRLIERLWVCCVDD